MMCERSHKRTLSRKRTPWDEVENRTETQEYLRMHYLTRYEQRHPKRGELDEAVMVNSYVPSRCPFCESTTIIKKGFGNDGVRRYRCLACNRTFRPTTNTIFDSRKIPISEWIDYCLNIFHYVSLNADSWANRNAFSTSKYWLEKLFLTLRGWQDNIVLSGQVWLDETYYSVMMQDRMRNDKGHLLPGISANQICIGVATDKKNTICLVEGYGRPSQKRCYHTFKNHIAPGSLLIHDKDNTHRKLIRKLSLTSQSYKAKDLKGLPDSENPLDPVNRVHALLKMFLNSHSGFNRDDLQGYCDLYAFVINPPMEHLEKVEKVIKMAFENPKLLRYRDQFPINTNTSGTRCKLEPV